MRPLRLVGLSDDGASVVLESEDGERFSVPCDQPLKDLLVPAPADQEKPVDPPLARIGATVTNSAITLSPRDIQTRVRAGESPEKLAEESGNPLERIMRFAEPVLQERFRVTDEARRGKARRGGDGALVTFGSLVDTRLSAHGVEPSAVLWDAFRREDGGWTVTAGFRANDKDHLARFAFALNNRTVSALNDIASDVLAGGQIRALLPEPPPPVHAPEPDLRRTTAKSDTSPVRLASVPDPDDDQAPAEPIPLRPPGGRQRAHTRHVPVALDDEVLGAEPELFDQTAFEDWHEPDLTLGTPAGGLFGAEPQAPTTPARPRAVPGPMPTTPLTPPPPPPLPVQRSAPVDEEPIVDGAAAEGPDIEPEVHEAAATEPDVQEAPAVEPDVQEAAAATNEPPSEPDSAAADHPHQPAAHRRKASDKPRMPSWDDILLGVRRKD